MTELASLRERAKELRCLYRVQEAVADRSSPPATVLLQVLEAIPDGWRYPERTGARIGYLGRHYVGPGFVHQGKAIRAALTVGEARVGFIEVVQTGATDTAAADRLERDPDAFLQEEVQLLDTIARRIGEYLEWKHTQLLGGRLPPASEHWRWRESYAEALVGALDRTRFGVSRVFLGGSTGSGHAGAGSDIDLFVEFHGSDEQRHDLTHWIEGWSLCLAELAYRETGYRVAGGLIDLHWIEEGADPRLLADLRVIGGS